MPPRTILATLTVLLVVVTACSTSLEREQEPRFRLTVEEAGFLAKGELFRIYGETADPVIVSVDATEVEVEGQPGWQLDTLVHVRVDGEVEERRWRFWVILDPDGFPAVTQAEDITQDTDD
ncbi:MAG: hypothetical protein J5I28_11875 [Acidimicrobiales bacterium]|nr:hypothetical protein [Acidimicrobiales bacterium]